MSPASAEPVSPIRVGDITWTPPDDVLTTSRVGAFLDWLAEHRGRRMTTHDELWRWSVDDLDGFWSAVAEFSGVRDHGSPTAVLVRREMPGATWFPGSLVNYAEHALLGPAWVGRGDEAVVLSRSQTRADVDLTLTQLRDDVGRAQQVLRDLGVRRGDRVAAYLPNISETLVAFLACAGLGAVWAGCACEFGAPSVVDRFAQVEPVVLLVAGGYTYGDKAVDRAEQVREIRAGLPSVRHVVDVRYGDWVAADTLSWPDLLAATGPREATFERVPFDHPLVVLFSSGTTGRPKAIVHGHGGILLEHLKNHALSWDMGAGDRMLWFTTTAWMMWNALVSSLLVGASVVLVDGNPLHPDVGWQWRLAEQTGATIMGASPGFLMSSRREGVRLAADRLRLRIVGAAGSPLPPEGYAWVRDQLGDRVQLNVGSGGTDICSGIVQNNPLLPVYAGEISGRCLGVDAHAFNEEGRDVVGELGELVITSPMPSMPVGLWGDGDGSRLRETYYDRWPGVWRHGDWVVFGQDGRCHVAGRSDATLNRGGVRLGTAEFYGVVEEIAGVADSLVVHLEDQEGGSGELLLFVVLDPGVDLDDRLRREITASLRASLSPRHVPDRVLAVPAVPRNLTGKKLELPVKRILQGRPLAEVASRDSLADKRALDAFVMLVRERTP